MKYFLLFITFLLSLKGYAQDFDIKRFGMEDGLSNNYIVDFAQDNNGCLWIATESGLNRFDGRNFKIYTTENSQISSNELNRLLTDPLDSSLIWIATQRDGLCLLDTRNNKIQTFLPTNSNIHSDNITDIIPARDGGIWILSFHSGICHYNRATNTFTSYTELTYGLKNWTIACDPYSGFLYVGHNDGGLSIIDTEHRKKILFTNNPSSPTSIPGNDVKAICFDNNGNAWIGTNNGLALYNPDKQNFRIFQHQLTNSHSLSSGSISDITLMNDETLWIGTSQGGISILDPKQLLFDHTEKIIFRNISARQDGHGLSNPYVRCIFQDSYQNIWIGNYHNGIDYISYTPERFKILPYSNHIDLEKTTPLYGGLFCDHSGKIWIGFEGKIACFAHGKKIKEVTLNPFSNILITNIYEDSFGFLWLATQQDDIYQYNPNTEQVIHHTLNPDRRMDTHSCYELRDKKKLLIAGERGIFYYDYTRHAIFKDTIFSKQLSDLYIKCFVQDKNQFLWVGAFGNGIAVFDTIGHLVKKYTRYDGFCSNAINDLYADSNQHIWAATRDGLVEFAIDSSIHYTLYNTSNGLLNRHVRAITEDSNQHIWISTNNGISMWDSSKRRFDNYTMQDGLPIGVFNNQAVCKDFENELYFACSNGVCYFNPTNIKSCAQTNKLQITDFHIYSPQDETWQFVPYFQNLINLGHRQNTIHIVFNVPDVTQNSQTEYAYLLQNFDNDWTYLGEQNEVYFRNLPYGYYTFKVRARIRNQEWGEDICSLNLYIAPSFYLSGWAKCCYAILLLFTVLLIAHLYKQRIKHREAEHNKELKLTQEKELNDERLRFFTNIAHEVRTPLTLIIGPLEDLMSDNSLPEKQEKKIGIIHQSAIHLLEMINQLLEFRKTETQNKKLCVMKADITTLLRGICINYKELNRNANVEIYCDIPVSPIKLYYDDEIITTIINNLMSNAIKYTEHGSITLCLKEENEYIDISVSDTGFGIDKNMQSHIFDRYYQVNGKHQASGTGIGLALVKNLTDIHKASISVSGDIGKGSVFTLRLSKYDTYPNALHKEKKDVSEIQQNNSLIEESSRSTLLLVEDNEDIRNYIYDSLSDSYDVLMAGNGKEGLDIAYDKMPQIIVSDIMMPEMDGFELCKCLKNDLRTCHIPIIFLTAKDSLNDRSMGYKMGVDSFLTKPFSSQLLENRIANLLESRHQLAKILSPITPETLPKESEKLNNILNKLDREFLDKLNDLVEGHIEEEKLDMDFLSDNLCMSHSSLYRKIKGLTDLSPNEYVRKLRLKRAEVLLSQEGYSVNEVITRTGFNSPSYFRQCFREQYGMTPTEYLKNNKQ